MLPSRACHRAPLEYRFGDSKDAVAAFESPFGGREFENSGVVSEYPTDGILRELPKRSAFGYGVMLFEGCH